MQRKIKACLENPEASNKKKKFKNIGRLIKKVTFIYKTNTINLMYLLFFLFFWCKYCCFQVFETENKYVIGQTFKKTAYVHIVFILLDPALSII